MRLPKAMIGQHEVVRVLTPAFLVSSAQQACRYETMDGTLLAPGYYLALWPTGVRDSAYCRGVRYLGPFPSQAEARLLQTSAAALEIVEAAAPAPNPTTQEACFGPSRHVRRNVMGLSLRRPFAAGQAVV